MKKETSKEVLDRAYALIAEGHKLIASINEPGWKKPKPRRGRRVYTSEMLAFVERLLWIKTGGRCFYCKKPVSFRFDEVPAVKDHYVPIAKGGRDDHSNLVPSCRECDRIKSNALPTSETIARILNSPTPDPSP